MSGLLADLYSAGDRMKRKLGGLLSNPLETVALGSQRMAEDVNALTRLASEAGYMPNTVNRADQSVLVSERQKALARALLADKGAEMGMAAATVWHGSPHKFDKFDSSKIGTGEGAQAYGHGLYLADAQDVARGYQNTLSSAQNRKFIDGTYRVVDNGGTFAVVKDIAEPVGSTRNFVRQSEQVSEGFPSRGHALSWLKKQGVDNLRIGKIEDGTVRQARSIRDIPEGDSVAAWNGGSLYKVDLPDNAIARMLDWDKPLSQQPEAFKAAVSAREQKRMLPILEQRKAALAGLPPDAPNAAILKKQIAILEDEIKQAQPVPSMTGGEYFNYLRRREMQPAEQAEWLRQAGIPGIRYLDGGSRGAGQGTSNYVVFPGNEGLLQILERNGVPIK